MLRPFPNPIIVESRIAVALRLACLLVQIVTKILQPSSTIFHVMLCCNKSIRTITVAANLNHLAKSRFACAMIAALVCVLLLGTQLAELTSAHEDCEDAICLCVSSSSDSDLDLINDGYFLTVVSSAKNVAPHHFGLATSDPIEHFKSIRAPPYN